MLLPNAEEALLNLTNYLPVYVAYYVEQVCCLQFNFRIR